MRQSPDRAFASTFGKSPSGAGEGHSDSFAEALQNFYESLLVRGIPPELAGLVRKLEEAEGTAGGRARKYALVVEADDDDRALASVLLEETGLDVIECASAEAALAVLECQANDMTFMFVDENLLGSKTALQLCASVGALWPSIRTVITLEEPSGVSVPQGVVALKKPWRGLDVLIQAERALATRKQREVHQRRPLNAIQ